MSLKGHLLSQPFSIRMCILSEQIRDQTVKGRWEYYFLFIYQWLCWIFIAVQGLSLVVVSVGYSVIVALGLLVLASLVEELRLWSVSSVVMAARLRHS